MFTLHAEGRDATPGLGTDCVEGSPIREEPMSTIPDLAPASNGRHDPTHGAERPAKPQAMPVNEGGIPAELREWPHCVCWQYEWDGERWAEVPIDPKTGSPASVRDSATWGTLEQAL